MVIEFYILNPSRCQGSGFRDQEIITIYNNLSQKDQNVLSKFLTPKP